MRIKGIAASNGICIAKVYRLEKPVLHISNDLIENIQDELLKLDNAIDETVKTLKKIREITASNINEENALIFDAHIQIANDPEIKKQCYDLINIDKNNAAMAYNKVVLSFILIFESMDNKYMRERVVDIKDVSNRVITNILGVTVNDLRLIDEEVILVAHDLTPSDTAQLNRSFIKGFITNIGGKTSHSAIMARSMEIPAVVGSGDVMDIVQNGDLMILDGTNGLAILSPTDDLISEYSIKIKTIEKDKILNQKYKDLQTITLDNHKVELAANIGSYKDIENVIEQGAEGIGLYRTEFLYMNSNDFPTEEEQFLAYRKVLEVMGDKKVIIRTLDIGGDKDLSYMEIDNELNPFLGVRAVRLCLQRKDLFRTQLRALLRASVYGNLHIMFPMVATISELREVKEFLHDCQTELVSEKIEVSTTYKIGIMVEVPAVAILADKFAKEVDFFSIGTNDLIQYTMAADRMNQKVSYLYQPYNPSILRLVKMVIDASKKQKIWTGMCGEMAGDIVAAPLLLGLGLDEFSMSPSSILPIRRLFSTLNRKDMIALAEKALDMESNHNVKEFVLKNLEGKI